VVGKPLLERPKIQQMRSASAYCTVSRGEFDLWQPAAAFSLVSFASASLVGDIAFDCFQRVADRADAVFCGPGLESSTLLSP
jgi:hypothetical protein